ncbi:MAG: CRTAC1 family protein [Planctomycetaceae bacterium]
MTEQNGGGVAIPDFDGDGNCDLYFVNGSHFTHSAQSHNASNALFRGDGQFGFRDVTMQAGMEAFNFGQGCAVGDFNNDGFSDVFVATFGDNSLWRNNGDGTFTDVSLEAGINASGFSSSAAFADLDGDGNLDLYVVNYLNWFPDDAPRERVQSPMDFEGQPDLLYRNEGTGQFLEIGQKSGIAVTGDGKGLAVAIADLDGDRRLDIYVANDTRRNFLFKNAGDFQFVEVGVPTGSAVSQDGSIGSSMGIAVTDYNLDNQPDLMVTNFAQEVVDILMNMGNAGFLATNTELGVDFVSRPVLNFGIVSADFNLDLWPDLFFANGHLYDETSIGGEYQMLPSILQNDGGIRFHNAAAAAGEYFQQRWLGRAAAMGDLDDDGDMDLVVSHLLDPPAILNNQSLRQGASRRVTFIGRTSSRQPLGCRVTVILENGRELTLQVPSGGSFQAAHDTTVIVPTGESGQIQSISIDWPDGVVETWNAMRNDQTLRLIEGTGQRSQ